MANTPMYDPLTSEARSSWLAGLTEACNKISNTLNLQTAKVTGYQLNELFISEDDRCRIYQADLGYKLWMNDPEPVIMNNGLVITPERDNFTIDYLGGSIIFEHGFQPDPGDIITASFTYVVGTSNTISELNKAIKDAQSSALAFRGYYNTYDDMVADIDDPVLGNFTIVGGTDNSVYIWNVTSKNWENTFKETDLSDYYTKSEVDDALDEKEDAIEAYGSTSTADDYYYGGRKEWISVSEKVLGTTLAGLVTSVISPVVAGDDILAAIGKLQAQIGDIGTITDTEIESMWND